MTTKSLFTRDRAGIVDAYRDLHCEMVTGTAATYNSATSSLNVSKIRSWMNSVAVAGERSSTLVIPYGYIAINDTLGRVAGSPLNTVSVPANCSILAIGGTANGRYPCNHIFNCGSAGFLWTGNSSTPMVQCSDWGAEIHANFYGYPYVTPAYSGADIPVVDRAVSAVRLQRFNSDGPANGNYTISGTFTGFTSAIDVLEVDAGHSDESYFPSIITRDCLSLFSCSADQSIGHTFGRCLFYCPAAQSIIFKMTKGGNCTVEHLSVVGDFGTTILELEQANENHGWFNVQDGHIDKSVTNATAGLSGGFFRLLHNTTGNSLAVRMRLWIASANANLATNWYNHGGEDVVSLASLDVGAVRTVKLDIPGLDTTTAALYPW